MSKLLCVYYVLEECLFLLLILNLDICVLHDIYLIGQGF